VIRAETGVGEMRASRIVSTRSDTGAERAPSAPTAIYENAPKSNGRLRAALLCGGMGFVAGAVFWHLVGFWSFMAEVVLDRTAAAQAAVGPPPRLDGVPSVILVKADRCTTLALNRRSNLTVAVPCANDGLALRLLPETATRDDLALLGERLQAAGFRPD